jgi:AcrR family transcriptional regulator
MPSNPDTTPDRRAALLEAARGVFLRYGFKKTSMDDLARAAGISRQGLYLHFPTKESLFREVIGHMLERTREQSSSAFARDDLEPEERIYAAFEAMSSDKQESDHVRELATTAHELLGSAFDDMEKNFTSDLARTLKSTGVAAQWERAGISAKLLAEHLSLLSNGLKHRGSSRADYLDRMRTAVRIVCRGTAR